MVSQFLNDISVAKWKNNCDNYGRIGNGNGSDQMEG